MKRLLQSILAATAICGPAAATTTEIYGVWARDGHPTDKLEFFDCSGKLCAKGILPMRDGSPPPLILRYATKTGPNSWKGDLYNPEDGKTYTGKITFETSDQLTLSGCLVAFLCQSETWTRISGPTKTVAPVDKTEAKGAKAQAPEAAKSADKEKDKTPAKAAAQDAAKGAKLAPRPSDSKSAPVKPAPAKAAPAKPAPAKPAAPKSGDGEE
ncbi:DUF2147 domain-containing protein [Methylocystis sp. MJC1]|jgi:uncharacterized protein (DUF2147 family)|uniref:DUF2147 domain-containing protein n=1 Tax=Methylocystis sp. MJC1 TaxID=2654282 RepID=UPI0013EC0F2D|nr:DUF2147 domain-containing protein [Methylocystis sp. MJC1]KAF2990682.1 hypothetical protein MJC1_02106 [Methylocystis sp. MJC1]MBU6528717.1 DUF2147 domain-containing protein [Methylocystis sp. MJC1]UZX11605.1 DUF2147 domain-containing protein [Methylocystis sp. MJC1]